jgi:large conductance mechanosensitive channel
LKKCRVRNKTGVKLKKIGGVLAGFRDFALRGNVIELAVGVAVGVAFTALVNELVNSVLNPLVAALFGKPDMSGIFILEINGSRILFGALFSAVLNFLIVATALYFCIILPINKLVEITNARLIAGKAKNAAEKPCAEENVSQEELLREIRDLLKAQSPAKLIKQPLRK